MVLCARVGVTGNRRLLQRLLQSRLSLSSHDDHFKTCWRTMTNSSQLLRVEQSHDGLRKITLIDSKTRNALSMQMMNELISAMENDKSDPKLRSIMITASPSGSVFSAGHNLKELTVENGIEMQRAIFAKCNDLMMAIRRAEVPVVAVVEGLAAAAGCQLVAACDFAIGNENAKFSTPGASFGIFCTTPGISVARSVHRSLAAYMVLTGLPLTATEACQAGLISKVVKPEALDSCVQEIHASICSKSRSVIKLGKEFFYKQIEMTYEEALKAGADVMVQNLQYQDAQEGLACFKEKRRPVWKHTDKTVKD